MDTKHIQIRDYDYSLPEERIAKYPLPERDSSKLLVCDGGRISETLFRSLPSLLPKGALMVFNNTRVIQARLHFRKGEAQDGALIEVFLLEPANPVEYQENFAATGQCTWYCLVGNLKKWKEGRLTREFTIHNSNFKLTAERIGTHGTSQEIKFEWWASDAGDGERSTANGQRSMLNGQWPMANGQRSMTFAEVIDAVGELPIPPYLNRKTEERDKTTYQTVYSKIKGSVAAPTAGLHFTERVLADIDSLGIEREEVTLHVGAGTFRPVKSEDIGGHDMHTEHIAVRRSTIERILAHGGKAIAVGTTSVRTLESLYWLGILASSLTPTPAKAEGASSQQFPSTGQSGEALHVPQWLPYEHDTPITTEEALTSLLRYMDGQGEDVLHAGTQIIIAPGYRYRIVSHMITNFHQPQSTLLLLVSAFIGERWHDVYRYALEHDFRFLSYGDSSLLIP